MSFQTHRVRDTADSAGAEPGNGRSKENAFPNLGSDPAPWCGFVAYGAWPFAVDVRLGLAAVSYSGSASETDSLGLGLKEFVCLLFGVCVFITAGAHHPGRGYREKPQREVYIGRYRT